MKDSWSYYDKHNLVQPACIIKIAADGLAPKRCKAISIHHDELIGVTMSQESYHMTQISCNGY